MARLRLQLCAKGKRPIQCGFVSGKVEQDYLRFDNLQTFWFSGFYELWNDDSMVTDFWVSRGNVVRGVFLNG